MPTNQEFGVQLLALAVEWQQSQELDPMQDEEFVARAADIMAAAASDRCNPPGGWTVQVTNQEYGVQVLELAVEWSQSLVTETPMDDETFVGRAAVIVKTMANERCNPHGGLH